MSEWHQRMTAQGLCNRCGKNPKSETLLCLPCRSIVKEQQRAYRAANREQYLQERRNHSQTVRQDVLVKYGGKCVCCGESHLPYLDIDHKNGGGNAERKSRGGGGYYTFLRRTPIREDLQLLCANCHVAKTRKAECPPHPLLSLPLS